jgi:hypothetical protein
MASRKLFGCRAETVFAARGAKGDALRRRVCRAERAAAARVDRARARRKRCATERGRPPGRTPRHAINAVQPSYFPMCKAVLNKFRTVQNTEF